MPPPQISDTKIELTNSVVNNIDNLIPPQNTDAETNPVANNMNNLSTSQISEEVMDSVVNSGSNYSVSQIPRPEMDPAGGGANGLLNSQNSENIAESFATLTTTDVTKVNTLATLVFFDLETTGLANSVGKKNVQITEVSMIAVSRIDFCKCMYPDLRDVRIQHKLSLCIKPNCPVSREASCLTGLTSINLKDQRVFDENTTTLITAFLSHLQKPVCILAHNGKLFDFPILKAEFGKMNTQLPKDVYIVDTLIGFRKLGMPELPFNQKLHKDVKFKLNGSISYALKNLHLYFFGKPHVGGHSSEGDCIALAKVCHKVRDRIIPWIEANCTNFDSIVSMW